MGHTHLAPRASETETVRGPALARSTCRPAHASVVAVLTRKKNSALLCSHRTPARIISLRIPSPPHQPNPAADSGLAEDSAHAGDPAALLHSDSCWLELDLFGVLKRLALACSGEPSVAAYLLLPCGGLVWFCLRSCDSAHSVRVISAVFLRVSTSLRVFAVFEFLVM
jgi:hypothetical protein